MSAVSAVSMCVVCQFPRGAQRWRMGLRVWDVCLLQTVVVSPPSRLPRSPLPRQAVDVAGCCLEALLATRSYCRSPASFHLLRTSSHGDLSSFFRQEQPEKGRKHVRRCFDQERCGHRGNGRYVCVTRSLASAPASGGTKGDDEQFGSVVVLFARVAHKTTHMWRKEHGVVGGWTCLLPSDG